jgi:beta-glucosidase
MSSDRPRRLFTTTIALVLALGSRTASAQATGAPASRLIYKDSTAPVPARVRDLLGRMTLEEKFWQTFMIPGDLTDPTQDYSHGVFGLQVSQPPSAREAKADAEQINKIQKYFVERTRLGIPMIPFEEALHGLRREGAIVFPQAIGLAATWDTTLVGKVAQATAREARSRGIRDALSPVINIANDVRWGRVEETYGEDPYLTSQMALAFVGAMEKNGVVATPKHFVANVGDGGRDSYPIDFSARLLEETYFPPFKAAITQAHARSVMSAYNSVDGLPATQNYGLLTAKLRTDWGFTGFVISDAAATGGATVLHHTEASTATATKDALDAGLDVIFQSSWDQHRPYLAAYRSGTIAPSVIDSAVSHVLKAKFELGLFEHPYADPDSAAFWNGNAAHRALALDAARESIVLLKNDKNVLPLKKKLKSLAVMGVDAAEGRLGGYSASGIHKVSILDGIREKLGKATAVRYVGGPGRIARDFVVIPTQNLRARIGAGTETGLRGEYFDNIRLDGQPRLSRIDQRVDFGWTLNSPGRGIPFDWYSVRWAGTILIPASGVHRIGVEGNDGYRLWIDDKLVLDDWRKQSFGTKTVPVSLAKNTEHAIRLEYFESTGNARVKLVWDAGVTNAWKGQIDSAVTAASRSDAAIVVAGVEEGEFRDRAFLKLPGHQEEMIQRVAATGKPVVVVIVGGSAVTMSDWLDRVDGVVDVWYPGEEGGHAVADILFGDANPAGRLPITFPVSEGQLPLVYNHKPTGRGDDYLDLTGQPLFPFGFGLSYTTFEYSNLVISPTQIDPKGTATVTCTVKNTGKVAGDEVVQLYVRDILASVARPIIMLEGFKRVHLEPGEEKSVSFTLSKPELQLLDASMRFVVEPGTFRVLVGASSKDIRLRGDLVVK